MPRGRPRPPGVCLHTAGPPSGVVAVTVDELRARLPGWVVFRFSTGQWVACPREAREGSPVIYAPTAGWLYLLVTRLN